MDISHALAPTTNPYRVGKLYLVKCLERLGISSPAASSDGEAFTAVMEWAHLATRACKADSQASTWHNHRHGKHNTLLMTYNVH